MDRLLRKTTTGYREVNAKVQVEPATPSGPLFKAHAESQSAALWRHALYLRGLEIPITLPPQTYRTPTHSEVRNAKRRATSRFERIDKHFFDRPRHANDDPY